MKTFLLHPDNESLTTMNLYYSLEDQEIQKSITDLNEIGMVDESDILIYLIPSSLISSYEFIQNKDLSNQINLANFTSDTEALMASQVSDNKFIFHNDNGYVIEENLLDKINRFLSPFAGKVYIIPEHFINHIENEDTITTFGNTHIFSYKNGTGFSTNESSLRQYIDIILNDRPDFNPIIFSSNSILKSIFPKSDVKSFSLIDFLNKDFNKMLNLFKFEFSFNLVKEKLNFTKVQLALSLISILVILLTPKILIYKNNLNANTYKDATFELFQSINKDIKRVVTPRTQIDQIVEQIPVNLSDSVSIPKVDFLDKLGKQYVKNISINILESKSEISLEKMPAIQFKAIKLMSENFNIVFLNEDISENDGFISGNIEVRLSND
jgi:hypothetical protein